MLKEEEWICEITKRLERMELTREERDEIWGIVSYLSDEFELLDSENAQLIAKLRKRNTDLAMRLETSKVWEYAGDCGCGRND